MEKKIIWSSGATALITALIVLGGVSITDPNNYGCEARALVMPCDSLAAYYGLPNGKCINAKLGNKLCSSGWTKDFQIEDEVKETAAEKAGDCPIKVIAYTNTGKYFCDCIGKDCPCIRTEEILSQLG